MVIGILDPVLPYTRPAGNHKLETTKFTFEREVKQVEEYETTETKPDGTTSKTTTKKTTSGKREKKVTLKIFTMDEKEDKEHFFEAFMTLKRELEEQWNEASQAKNRDATVLFDAFDKMLGGVASTEWRDTLAEKDPTTQLPISNRDWETFKTLVSHFITRKVIRSKQGFEHQRQYLQEQTMPMGMDVRTWNLRRETLNGYLPYMIDSMEMLKKWFPDADFKGWWVKGAISPQEMKVITINRAPKKWQDDLARVDISRSVRDGDDIEKIIDHFARLQTEERARQASNAVPRTGRFGPGRHALARAHGRGRYQHIYGSEDPNRNQINVRGQSYYYNPGGRIPVYYSQRGGGRTSSRGWQRPTQQQPQQFQQQQWQRPPSQGRFGQQGRPNPQMQRQPGRFYQPQAAQSQSYYTEEQATEYEEANLMEAEPNLTEASEEQEQQFYYDDENLFMEVPGENEDLYEEEGL